MNGASSLFVCGHIKTIPAKDADFHFKMRDGLPELDLISFVVNVYSRIHSHIDLDLVPSHNDFLKEFIYKCKATSFEETVDVFLEYQEKYFQMFYKNKIDVVQNYIYIERNRYFQIFYLFAC